jgi:four helix bundle protein
VIAEDSGMITHRSLIDWQVADQLATEVYQIATVRWRPDLSPAWDQLRRAVLSVPLNLAEGYRWRPGRRCRFHLQVANGSALEATEGLRFLIRLGAIPEPESCDLLRLAERSEKLIWGLLRKA